MYKYINIYIYWYSIMGESFRGRRRTPGSEMERSERKMDARDMTPIEDLWQGIQTKSEFDSHRYKRTR